MKIWDWYEVWLEARLKKLGFSLEKPAALSKAILTLSDFYQSKNVTPWQKPETVAAYLVYFLPLNLTRAQAVFEIFKTQGPKLNDNLKILDFGSGAGTTELTLALSGFKQAQIEFLEISPVAIDLHKSLHSEIERHFPNFKAQVSWSERPTNNQYDLGIFQTSLNEMGEVPPLLSACETLVLIEPATAEKARPLMSLRQQLIDRSYQMWAPCTHQRACPLLVESKRDWCHDRIYPELPSWFEKLLPHLPIQNAELTFSYLIASQKHVPETSPRGRMVGEAQWEKGKVRQMFCRGEKREFLSWLRRKGDPVTPERGDLISTEGFPTESTGEVRLDSEAQVLWTRKKP